MEKVTKFLKELEDKGAKIDKDNVKESFKKGFVSLGNKKLDYFPSIIFTTLNDEKIQVKEINFANNEIKEIPRSVLELSNLSSVGVIDFGVNHLTVIPKEFSNFTSLTRLTLMGNHIKELPESLILDKLLFFDLNSNILGTIPTCIPNLKSLQRLVLKSNFIKKIPSGLKLPKSLLFLDISDNQIEEIPEEFFEECENLKEVKLFVNQLKSVPLSLTNLKNLLMLDMTKNKLSKIPSELGSVKSLTNLFIARNSLTEIPSTIGDLENLTVLNLSKNKLKELPDSISNLKSLKVLLLACNSLKSLINFDKMVLEDFRIGGNKIKEISESLCEIQSLTRLEVAYNRIEELPKNFGNLKNLSVLNIAGNKIKVIPEEFKNFQSLQMIHLGDNDITSLPFGIDTFPKLTYFSCWGNNLKEFSHKDVEKLRTFDVSLNKNLKCDIEKLQEVIDKNELAFAQYCQNTIDYYNVKVFQITPSARYNVGIYEMLGLRPSMEDHTSIRGKLYGENVDFYAVYDGHAGKLTSAYASKRLPQIILDSFEQNILYYYMNDFTSLSQKLYSMKFSEIKKYDPVKILRSSIKQVNEEIKQKGYEDGSTAVMALIYHNECIIANVGDSRCVLCDANGKAHRLSIDHKPTTVEERQRIEKLGGVVINNRIKNLALSRALGDFAVAPYLSAEPYINAFTFKGDEEFLIIACDGVFDELSDQKSVDVVLESLKKDRSPFGVNRAAAKLCNVSYGLGSLDNITCLIVDLKAKKEK